MLGVQDDSNVGRGKGVKQRAEVKRVKSLLFFCPAPVARPLLPPSQRSVMLTGGKGAGENVQKLCERVRLLSLCFYANLHVFCVLICLLVKKEGRGPHKGGENPALSSQTNNFHCK